MLAYDTVLSIPDLTEQLALSRRNRLNSLEKLLRLGNSPDHVRVDNDRHRAFGRSLDQIGVKHTHARIELMDTFDRSRPLEVPARLGLLPIRIVESRHKRRFGLTNLVRHQNQRQSGDNHKNDEYDPCVFHFLSISSTPLKS